jgi:hypothetical protein
MYFPEKAPGAGSGSSSGKIILGRELDPFETIQFGGEKRTDKDILEEVFAGKTIDQVVTILSNKNSEARFTLARMCDDNKFLKNLDEISRSIRSVGMINAEADKFFAAIPNENQLRFMVYEAAVRSMLEVGFSHFNTLTDIFTALEQMEKYVHAVEAVELNLTASKTLVESLIQSKRAGVAIEGVSAFFEHLTRKYKLRDTVRKCYESTTGI